MDNTLIEELRIFLYLNVGYVNDKLIDYIIATAYHETDLFRSRYEYNNFSNYRGSGIFQLTGKNNYELVGKFLCIDDFNYKHMKDPLISAIALTIWARHNKLFNTNNFKDFTYIVHRSCGSKLLNECKVRSDKYKSLTGTIIF